MYKVDKGSGAIHFPDEFILNPPYESERYYEYAAWVQAGNSPEEIEGESMLAEEDIEVRSAQAKIALVHYNMYDTVKQLMAEPTTSQEVKLKWEYETVFKRNDPVVMELAGLLKLTPEQLTALFQYAKLIP